MLRAARSSAALAAVLLLAGGCFGGSGGGSSSSGVSHARFVAQARAICATYQKRIALLKGATTLPQVAQQGRRAIALEAAELKAAAGADAAGRRPRRLRPPARQPADRDRHRAGSGGRCRCGQRREGGRRTPPRCARSWRPRTGWRLRSTSRSAQAERGTVKTRCPLPPSRCTRWTIAARSPGCWEPAIRRSARHARSWSAPARWWSTRSTETGWMRCCPACRP